MKRFLLLFFSSLSITWAQKPNPTQHLQPSVFAVTMVMIHDVVNPPAAARFYSYCLMGAQEFVSGQDKKIPSPTLLAKNFKKPDLSSLKSYDYAMAATYCILETGRLILPSGYMLEEDEKKLVDAWKQEGKSQQLIDEAIAAAQLMAKHVIAYSTTDQYGKLSTRLRYRPIKGDGYWYPTPPGYMEAVEPHWKTIRPFMLDTCNQFAPKRPVTFSRDTTSDFYKIAYEVYKEGKDLSPEHRAIASYWDCNPFAINTSGHMMIGFKKISPGGHWMNITSIATTQAKLSFNRSVLVLATTAMTLHDSFISCWDEKYRSNRIRPETYIQQSIDKTWQPLLQTPPFPEYTSGHSVVSTAVAEVLTFFIGDDFAFTDNTEVIFDLPTRQFKSFRQAAAEAAVSRLYGGIHYRDSIEHGQEQGRNIGNYVIARVKKAGYK
ncbi:haloperoxidase [Siphonobacter sp. SORGH_AS_0500]|uniref:vanadium-dependent haloperoxidase n=1 Tax=Siphonobacter sp. SORGH_AS_0500 TaxID=1864824 RepID=UPI000CC7529A|nr:vanadium-dependent haloperoxidase [Siphonobacter sp. SORGH_AS_0500]PKK35848.1 haloperoxidase [Siphonobacter sp. SORGH_AS_0500]